MAVRSRRPYPSRVLVGLAIVSVAAAAAIGIVVALERTLWILPLVAVGVALVPAYNLALFGGRVHTDLGFALAWGAFPVVTAFVAQTGTIRVEAILAAAWATLLSLAQRRLSHDVRRLRRSVEAVEGRLLHADGTSEPVTREALLQAPETALRLLALATVVLAMALIAVRV